MDQIGQVVPEIWANLITP